MKKAYPALRAALFLAAAALTGCGQNPGLSLLESPLRLELPEPPAAWRSLLGTLRWRVEWTDPDGVRRAVEAADQAGPEITLPHEWPSPVTAWPFFPDRGIRPGTMKPAGAIFPWDASGGGLRLSWQGGVDAVFYRELAAVSPGPGGETRRPIYLDWPRFRELFTGGLLSGETLADPWTVNWASAAQKTVQSGFRRSYIKSETRTARTIPVEAGFWTGVSPFAPSLSFGDGEDRIFPTGENVDAWFSAGGTLHADSENWMFLPW